MLAHSRHTSFSLGPCLWSWLFAVSLAFVSPAVTADEPAESHWQQSRPLLLAHYMPWYVSPPTSEQWGWHWTMNHFDPEQSHQGRRQVASQFYPLIGPYDSGDVDVLEYHLLLMKLAGIDGVIVDWYGLTQFNDYPMLHRNTTRMLQACERLQMKFAICYEDQTLPALEKANRLKPDQRVAHVAKEIEWLNQYWFQSAAYVRLEDQPLLLSFGNAGLTNEEWTACLRELDFPLAYFSQSIRRVGAVGGFDWPSPRHGFAQIDRFQRESQAWPHAIPGAFPRFVDIYAEAGVQEGYPDIPDDEGNTWKTTLSRAIAMKPPVIQLITWNDWGEGTQIEPSREFGYRDLEHVQIVRRQLDPSFAAQRADLQLPLQIYRDRKSRAGSPDTQQPTSTMLDQLSQAISQGRFAEARRMLTQLK